ncbi:hypothetical protein O3M35_004010 [Rhynocoris fuscipes]|uniref:Uncharacterized protein n=1 Tax=Rhynocoris fuscipes TaxID=488301 RepID=A0AAW1CNP6_9HEMI
MFPSGAQDMNLMWLLSRLRDGTPGLVVHVRHHPSSDSYAFYLTAPYPILLKAAEEVHLPKSLRSSHGGGLKEFIQSDVTLFEGSEDEEHFFTSQERQYLVLHLLQTLRATSSDSLPGVKLIDGQPISKFVNIFTFFSIYFNIFITLRMNFLKLGYSKFSKSFRE